MRTIVKKAVVAMAILLFTSCATLIYKDTTNVNVYTKQKNVKVSFIDTSRYAVAPVTLEVERFNEPLSVTLRNDSVSKTITIPAKLNQAFINGNVFNFTCGLGHLMDLTNYRRFSYPSTIYVDLNDSIQFTEKYKAVGEPNSQLKKEKINTELFEKGSIGLKWSIPECNSLYLKKETQSGNIFGFFGATAEFDYYYATGNFVGLGGGGVLTFVLPLPSPLDLFGQDDWASGTYVDVLHGHRIKNCTIRYGLSMTANSYSKKIGEVYDPYYSDDQVFNRTENKLGLSLAAAYNVSNMFSVGFKYLPSFYTLNTNEFRYGHILFLDLAFNLTLVGIKLNACR